MGVYPRPVLGEAGGEFLNVEPAVKLLKPVASCTYSSVLLVHA